MIPRWRQSLLGALVLFFSSFFSSLISCYITDPTACEKKKNDIRKNLTHKSNETKNKDSSFRVAIAKIYSARYAFLPQWEGRIRLESTNGNTCTKESRRGNDLFREPGTCQAHEGCTGISRNAERHNPQIPQTAKIATQRRRRINKDTRTDETINCQQLAKEIYMLRISISDGERRIHKYSRRKKK